MQRFSEVGDLGAPHRFISGSSRVSKSVAGFREKEAPRSRFLKSPEGSKSMAGATKVIIRVNATFATYL